MTRLAYAFVLAGMLCYVSVATAGTWQDSFDDNDFWDQWKLFDDKNAPVETFNSIEENGRLSADLAPGSAILMSASSFEGDVEFRAQFMVPKMSARGRLGIVLRQSPWAQGGGQTYIRLELSDNPSFAAGKGVGDDAKSSYQAVSSFTLQIARTGTSAVASVGEDDEALSQIGQAMALPEGPLEALVEMTCAPGTEALKAELEEVVVKGDKVTDTKPQSPGGALADGEGKTGKPFRVSEASRRANLGFKLLRERNWDQALNEYALAASLEPKRFGPFHDVLKNTFIPKARGAASLDQIKRVTLRDFGFPVPPENEITVGQWLLW